MRQEKIKLLTHSLLIDLFIAIIGIVLCILKATEAIHIEWWIACIPFIFIGCTWLLDFLLFGAGYIIYSKRTQDVKKKDFLEYVLFIKNNMNSKTYKDKEDTK